MRIFYITFLILGISLNCFGQRLVNGSLEGVPSLVPCNFILKPDYTAEMGNSGCFFGDTLSTTSVPTIFYLSDTCNEGSAHLGKTFIGISAQNSKTDMISMLLDTPTIDWYGRQYTLKYYAKKPKTGTAISIVVGCSADCNSFGVGVDSVSAPTDTTWGFRTLSFLPPPGTKYITVKGKNTTNTRLFTFIDDFSFTPDIVGVAKITGDLNMSIYPNPMTNSTSVRLNNETILPCNYSIYDLTGRLIISKNNINSRSFTVNRENIPTGVYILHLNDSKGASGISRLVID